MTGAPGAGKSTVAVDHAINRYAMEGRKVVANFPIDFSGAARRPGGKLANATCYVIPDRPTRADLDLLEFGGTNEHDAGLLIIDEAGTWLNSRTWNVQIAGQPSGDTPIDEDGGPPEGRMALRARALQTRPPTEREKIIDWLTQSRKRYWDIILVAQAISMLDKQVRDAVCEMVVSIRRFDRKKVLGVRLPRAHYAVVRYGPEVNAPVLEKWFYTGKEAHKCFASYRLFGSDAAHYTVLPPRLTKFRGPPPPTRADRVRAWLRADPPGQVVDGASARPPLAPRHPLTDLLAKLPPAERLAHWRRLEARGAFERLKTLPAPLASSGGPRRAL